MAAGDLATARLHWQMGSWDKLAALEVESPKKGSMSRDKVELLLYKMQGLFVSGAQDKGCDLAKALLEAGVSRRALGAALISGAQSNIARAHLANGKHNRAKASIAAAIAQNPELGEAELVEKLRFENEQRHAAMHQPAASARVPYIDVIGPSGSGKTTLLQALAEQEGLVLLKKPGQEQMKAADASHMMFSFMLEHPRFVQHVADVLQCTPESDKLRQFLENALVRYTSAVPKPGMLHLFDEGFVSRANSLFAYSEGPLNEDAVRKYLRSVPLPAALIVLRVPADLCMERLKTRPKGLPQRMRALNDQEKAAIFQKMKRISDIAGAEMQALGVPAIHFHDGEAISEMAEQVVATIMTGPEQGMSLL